MLLFLLFTLAAAGVYGKESEILASPSVENLIEENEYDQTAFLKFQENAEDVCRSSREEYEPRYRRPQRIEVKPLYRISARKQLRREPKSRNRKIVSREIIPEIIVNKRVLESVRPSLIKSSFREHFDGRQRDFRPSSIKSSFREHFDGRQRDFRPSSIKSSFREHFDGRQRDYKPSSIKSSVREHFDGRQRDFKPSSIKSSVREHFDGRQRDFYGPLSEFESRFRFNVPKSPKVSFRLPRVNLPKKPRFNMRPPRIIVIRPRLYVPIPKVAVPKASFEDFVKIPQSMRPERNYIEKPSLEDQEREVDLREGISEYKNDWPNDEIFKPLGKDFMKEVKGYKKLPSLDFKPGKQLTKVVRIFLEGKKKETAKKSKRPEKIKNLEKGPKYLKERTIREEALVSAESHEIHPAVALAESCSD